MEFHHGRRRSRTWLSLSHALYAEGPPPLTTADRALAWANRLPAQSVLTHLSAAELRGWWLPPLPRELPVFIATGPNGMLRHDEVRVCRHPDGPVVHRHDGLPLASPAEIVLACCRDLSLLDVVVIAESALASGDCTGVQLVEAAAQFRRGAPLLRRVLPWLHGHAESPWEVLLGMLLRSGGVPVVPQHEVRDAAGVLIARGDLWIEGTRTLMEFDGGVHLTSAQQARDLARDRRLHGVRWQRNAYTAGDLRNQPHLILRDAYDALGWTRAVDLTQWLEWWRPSLFTPWGQSLLRQRLHLPEEPRTATTPGRSA